MCSKSIEPLRYTEEVCGTEILDHTNNILFLRSLVLPAGALCPSVRHTYSALSSV